MSPPLRLGILGAARIAPRALVEPARDSSRAEVVSVAARDPERARAFALENGIPRAEPSYDALLNDPEVDAVYVALPNSAHALWSIRALAAGKHVLCEKPLASNATEAEEMVLAAAQHGRILMEAFHYRYHPMAHRIVDIVRSGQLGALRDVAATFTVEIPEADIRFDGALAGGALMDLGCYTVHWVRTLAGEPTVASARATVGPPGVDVTTSAELVFPGNVTGRIHCSMAKGAELHAFLEVRCERGTVVAQNPLAPQFGYRLRVKTDTGERLETVAGGTSYGHQLEAFVDAVLTGKAPLTAGEDAVANMRVIDAIYRAAGLTPRG